MASLRKSRPKLKDSCDTCAAAKVRCGKEKPACRRCHEKGHTCVYSFSCRAGRHLVKGDKSSPPLGNAITHSSTTSPTFPYSQLTDPSIAYVDSPTSCTAAESPTGSRYDSVTGMYSGTNYYSFTSGNAAYPMSFSNSPSESSIGSLTGPTDFAALYRSRNDSQGIRSNSSGSSNSRATSSFSSLSGLPPINPAQEPSWGSPDQSSIDLDLSTSSSSTARQCIMGSSQSCLYRLCTAFSIQPAELPPLSSLNVSGPPSIVVASGLLDRAFDSINDPIMINEAILRLASSALSCSCSSHDPQLQNLLVAVAFNVMARYSAVVFAPKDFPDLHGCKSLPHRAQLVLDELHRVGNFLDVLDRRLQASPTQPTPFRTSSSTSLASASAAPGSAGLNSAYAVGAPATLAALYPCSSTSSSSSSSAVTTPEFALDPGFAFSAVELRRRLQGLRHEIVSRMTST